MKERNGYLFLAGKREAKLARGQSGEKHTDKYAYDKLTLQILDKKIIENDESEDIGVSRSNR